MQRDAAVRFQANPENEVGLTMTDLEILAGFKVLVVDDFALDAGVARPLAGEHLEQHQTAG